MTLRERFTQWLAWKLPRTLVHWTVVRAATSNADGASYPYNPGCRRVDDVLRGW